VSDVAPRVSVCIPAYNRRSLFRATLWSVLQQTFRDFEVVVSDNASGDDLAAEVEAAGDPRIRYIRQDRNLGAAGNFHFLEHAATGDYVLFLCSDDLLLPECLTKAVAALDASPSHDAAVYMSAHYGDRGFSHLSTMPDRPAATAAEYASDPSVRDFRYAAPSLCLYRRQAFLALGGWDRRLQAIFDWEMYARTILRGGGVVFIHEPLAIMRLHEDRVSTTSALQWGYFHDAMLLSAKHEYAWGGPYRAMAFLEQSRWDWRSRRSPRRALRHLRETGALLDVMLHLPYVIVRRALRRAAHDAGGVFHKRAGIAPQPGPAALDAFWRAGEAVRAAG
jgi:glycosyltransferase involved in cell wall biosynthesis